MSVKHIERGTVLYRGGTTGLRNLPVFFALNRNTANVYGQVSAYRVRRNLKLLNMGSPYVIRELHSLAANKIVNKSLQKAFRLNGNNGVRRFSRIKYDIHVAQFVCKLGYDGYYAPELRNAKTTQGKFHPEIVLCAARQDLNFVEKFNATRPPRNKVGVNNRLTNTVMRTNYSTRRAAPAFS
jgi:hypothetical protein